MVSTAATHALSNTEIRSLILAYLYERNANATSARGDKAGAAVKISVLRKELKTSHGLRQQQVWSNLNYLISQGWADVDTHERSVPTPGGRIIPSSTSYYRISATGIDKIEGPGEYTMDRFHGIHIEATGQSVVTVGDGNQVNARFSDAAEAIAELKEEIRYCEALTDSQKIDCIGDIDSMQSQLSKPAPNQTVLSSLWEAVKKTALLAGLTNNVTKIAENLSHLLP